MLILLELHDVEQCMTILWGTIALGSSANCEWVRLIYAVSAYQLVSVGQQQPSLVVLNLDSMWAIIW